MANQAGDEGVRQGDMLQMFREFAMYMRQQQNMERMEESITKAIQSVVNKVDQFEGRDVSKYIKTYQREMELNRVSERQMVENFERVVVPEIKARVQEIQEVYTGNWEEFKKALKEEYFMEDLERVTKRNFLEWVAKPNKGLSATELLREFERKYSQLSTREQQTLEVEKTELFLQAADVTLQRSLEVLLEDKTIEQGLKTEWKEIEEAVSLLTKRQKRRDKMVMATTLLTSTTAEQTTKPTAVSPKVEESILDELVKGMQEMQLKLTRLENKGQSSEHKPQTREGYVSRCIWCDDRDHFRKDCDAFKDALSKGVVFFKDGKIHLRETRLPLGTNFGKGGM